MNKKTFAGIDVGSNAIRLLLKDVDLDDPELKLHKLQLVRIPLRLGTDAFGMGKISKKNIDKLVSLMKAFRHLMDLFEVTDYRACATSAMREVSNGKKVLRRVKKTSGINLEIISGDEEARLVRDQRMSSIECLGRQAVLFVDVGGGSTELNLFDGMRLISSVSFNIGTVRILQQCVSADTYDSFYGALRSFKERYNEFVVVGTGGNINKLVRLAKEDPTNTGNRFISVEKLRKLRDEMLPLTINERMTRYNLKADRADVIVPAADLFCRVVEVMGAKGVSVPTSGLADGIINDLFMRYTRSQRFSK